MSRFPTHLFVLAFLLVGLTGGVTGSLSAAPAPVPDRAAGAAGVEFAAESFSPPPLPFQQEDTIPEEEDEDDEAPEGLPLEATRSLSLTLDEGTWISLDVSPDGETIVFELLGDLYTVPIEGGEATAITSGLAFDAQPRFSPDGDRVLFVSDRTGGENLWTLNLENGDTLRITDGNDAKYLSPAWTPDGNYVVASRGESRIGVVNLWLSHVEGGAGRMLVEEPEDADDPPKTVGAAVSPDGRFIWHARRSGSWDYNAAFPQYQLEVFDRQTGQTYPRSSRYGSAFRPTLSPDGRWLVYGTRYEAETGLRLRDLETGDERWLAHPVQRDDQESVADRDVLPGMAFTPDSEELVASWDGKIWRVPLDGGDPIEVPFEVEADVALGPEVYSEYRVDDEPSFLAREIRDAVPSPDGDRLAFTAMGRLYTMTWPDGDPVRLTDTDQIEAQPTWSPDGEWIAYVTWDDVEGGHVRRVRADGSASPEQLSSTPALFQEPAWSPRRDRIVVLRGAARAWQEATGPLASNASHDLVWLPADGGDATLIAPAGGRSLPHFTRDEDRIHLFHPRNGLVSIQWDGGDERELVAVEGHTRERADEPNRASAILRAPEGDRVVARVENDLYTMPVPYVGEPVTINVSRPGQAPFPVRKLTDIGGQFPAWGPDGTTVHWSIGNGHFSFDLERARTVEDSLEAVTGEEPDPEEAETEEDAEDEEPGYEPLERRIEIEAARDRPGGTAVLRGARVVTMVDDEVVENADVVVRDHRIEAVGPRGDVDVPDDARIVDLEGRTIVPGFVDTHAHIRPAWGIHKNQVWGYLANLAYGVTTTRDPQTSTTDVLTYADLVEAGEMIGPRVYSTGPGIFGDYAEDPIRDLDHARDVMRRYSEYYDTKTIKMYMAGNRQQRQWIAIAAREQGITPTTEGGLSFMYDLTLAMDGYPGLEHNLPIHPLQDDVIALMSDTRVAYTPTLLVSYGGPWAENYWFAEENPYHDPKLQRFTPQSDLAARARRRTDGWFMEEEHVFQKHAQGVRQVLEAGGRVGVGSHGQLQGLGYHWELWSMASGGMANHDALRAATIMGAEAIGLQQDLGTVESGKLADLVVLGGNPLDDLRATNEIEYVMKNGRLYEGDTLDEIWPREQTLERSGWVQEGPPEPPLPEPDGSGPDGP